LAVSKLKISLAIFLYMMALGIWSLLSLVQSPGYIEPESCMLYWRKLGFSKVRTATFWASEPAEPAL
jgi:hypothetical protein